MLVRIYSGIQDLMMNQSFHPHIVVALREEIGNRIEIGLTKRKKLLSLLPVYTKSQLA
jgi:hypothetical protein